MAQSQKTWRRFQTHSSFPLTQLIFSVHLWVHVIARTTSIFFIQLELHKKAFVLLLKVSLSAVSTSFIKIGSRELGISDLQQILLRGVDGLCNHEFQSFKTSLSNWALN